MTLRTLSGCLEMINIRTHNEFALNAGIHGHKVELKTIIQEVEDLSEELRLAMEKTVTESLRRKFEEKSKVNQGT